jgi:segregation and condensation protein B
MSESQRIEQVIEALLFASPEGLTLQEISEKMNMPDTKCQNILKAIQKQRLDQAIQVRFEGNKWRMVVREDIAPKLHGMLSLPAEVSKSLIKTLAVIAYKAPVKQSDIIKIRGNKAYDHIKKLGEEQFISSKPQGRTKVIKLGQRFYDYFHLSHGEEKYLFEQRGD